MDDLVPPRFYSSRRIIEGKLWGITGYFSQPGAVDSMPFGGYFFLESLLGREIIFGKLIDSLGAATIVNGQINLEEKFSFDKRYDQSHHNLIRYDFEKNGNIWIGSYKTKNIEGRANCVIQPLT